MRITESCAECLYDKQAKRRPDPEYLRRVKELLDQRQESDTSPYMVYRFNQLYDEMYGHFDVYAGVKKMYSDLVLRMEDRIRNKIENSEEPLRTALFLARIGNYIDFGAMNHVSEDKFMELLEQENRLTELDLETYQIFVDRCQGGKEFLLITDNCGEIVMDKLLVEQLHKRFPSLKVTVMVRGGDILNDATLEDAHYVGIDKVAEVISNGRAIGGTIYSLLPSEAAEAFDRADVILAKGQGNYESLSGQEREIFYTFLCKCDLFTRRFHVDRLTGMFLVQNGARRNGAK